MRAVASVRCEAIALTDLCCSLSQTGAVAGERLKGRIGVVVGGNTGLGQLVAVRLAKEGATIVVLDTKPAPGANSKSVVDQIAAQAGAPAATLTLGDLHDAAFVDAAYAAVVKEHKRIDFVVNCVAAPSGSVSKSRALHEVTDKEWDDAMNVSAKAVFLSCKRAIQIMLAQDNSAIRGRIVNISSMYGMVARRGHFTFGVSKSAVVQLTRQVAAEYAASGIVCNAVAPGFIDDSINRDDCLAPASANRVAAEAPGKAIDVANAVLFLVSDDAQYIHGTNLLVDGGAMAT